MLCSEIVYDCYGVVAGMKELKITNQFKKDLKRYQNQPKRINKFKELEHSKTHKSGQSFRTIQINLVYSVLLQSSFPHHLQISPQQLFQRLLQNGSGAADVHSGEAFAFGAEGGSFYETEARFPDKKFG